MRERDRELAQKIAEGLRTYELGYGALAGIRDLVSREVLMEQLIESNRRVTYIAELQSRDISPRRADPMDPLFDPVRAAIIQKRNGDLDEAYWLVFLFVHFGKHRSGRRDIREIYGRSCGGELSHRPE